VNSNQKIKQVLIKYWGYSSFRPLQEDIILNVLNGNDTLALLPTGGGKSLTFQVPTMVSEGMCLVVTPLIALMKDQVHNLNQKNISAAAIYSGMAKAEIEYVFQKSVYGKLKFLYLSPERLETEIFLNYFEKMNICLIAVDEAHCISQWGYDFRPPYLGIANIRKYHPNVPILALTATATLPVVKDIQDKLCFTRHNVQQKSFYRSNLIYEVYYEEDKLNRLLKICEEYKRKTGIVYVRNRKKTKEIANFLLKNKIRADFYHAGLSGAEREKKQNDWTSNKTGIIVSTNAFGMGIDKHDVRFVVHMDLPDCIESYFQEAGRGGRDEKLARGMLLYNNFDINSSRKQLETSFPPIEEIKKTYYLLGSFYNIAIGSGKDLTFDFNFSEFTTTYSLSNVVTFYAFKFIEKQGYIILSEAIHNPSKVHIKVNKNELYKFQVENPKLDMLIKMLLRSYTGLFSDFVKIDEAVLAKRLKVGDEQIINALKKIEQMNIISYIERSDKPKVTFLTERIHENDFFIDDDIYKNRKIREAERLECMIEYVESTAKCRSQFLLNYFGETNAKRCGKCDVCLGRNKLTINELEFDNILGVIKPSLRSKSMTTNEVCNLFKPEEKHKVLEVIRWLADNKKITVDENKIIKWVIYS